MWVIERLTGWILFATLEQGLVIRRLGALAPEDQDALRQAIGQIIG